MTQWLKQSTSATIKLGPFVDDTDAKTAETGLTISQADIRLSKNGGNIAQTNDATGATHDELGYYDVPLDATDTNTLGRLRVAVHEGGALPVWQDFMVVPANVYDSLVLGTDYLEVDSMAISGDATAADNLEAAADGTGYNLGGGDIVAASVTGAVGSVTGAVGSVTAEVTADVTKISGDATAADNAEAFFDGTGYAGTNNVIPTVTAVTNEVTANATKISGSATAADNLEASALAVVTGTAITGTLTATDFTTDLAEVTDDHYNGRVVVFTSGVLAGQAKAILDYDGATKTLTTRTFTEAPGNSDAFVIV